VFVSCGISKEARNASANLVEQQKKTLESHISFHKAVLDVLGVFLEAEEQRSELTFKESVKDHEKALLDELKKIYDDGTTTDGEKKVKEEELRRKIKSRIDKAKNNKDKRDSLITQAKESLQNASVHIIKTEEAKTKVIVRMNEYLQMKRPSEKILEYVNVDLDSFNEETDSAKKYIDKTLSVIELLKK